jgi:manganese/zinc/iron transport system permease protein
MSAELQILLIAVVTAVAAALPGTFLVLRRMSLVSDAISHAILPGIVVAFFLTGDLGSPLLVVAAALTGVLTVALIEALGRTGLVREDAAIGLVFPALFSIGVVLISRYAGGVHLDIDVVLTGELAFAPFQRLLVAGRDLGPRSLWTMGLILVANLLLIGLLYKELKLATVDSQLAALLGLSPVLVHYLLMTMVSVTAVGAFEAVGSILVVALMIAPPASAYLLAERLGTMLGLSAAIAAAGAVLGYGVAHALDVSISGAMATAAGALFAVVLVVAPERGLLAQARRRTRQRLDLAIRMLAVHLLHHQDTPVAAEESRITGLHHHLQWSEAFTREVVRAASSREVVVREQDLLVLTESGRELAGHAVSGRLAPPPVERP